MATSMTMASKLTNLTRMFASHINIVSLRPTQHMVPVINHQVCYQSTATDYPGQPKKPPRSSYHIFHSENRQTVAAQNPGLSPRELMTKLGHLWTNLTDQEKQSYQSRAEEFSKRYKEEMEDFKAGISEEEWKGIVLKEKSERAEKSKRKKKREMKKTVESLGKPKSPGGTLSIYMKECYLRNAGKSFDEMVVDWKNMSDEEKQVYKDMRTRAQVAYKEALEEWTEKMIAEGHTDVVKGKTHRKGKTTKRKGKSKEE